MPFTGSDNYCVFMTNPPGLFGAPRYTSRCNFEISSSQEVYTRDAQPRYVPQRPPCRARAAGTGKHDTSIGRMECVRGGELGGRLAETVAEVSAKAKEIFGEESALADLGKPAVCSWYDEQLPLLHLELENPAHIPQVLARIHRSDRRYAFDTGISSSPCNRFNRINQIVHQVSLIIAILDKDIMTFDKDIGTVIIPLGPSNSPSTEKYADRSLSTWTTAAGLADPSASAWTTAAGSASTSCRGTCGADLSYSIAESTRISEAKCAVPARCVTPPTDSDAAVPFAEPGVDIVLTLAFITHALTIPQVYDEGEGADRL